MGPSEYAQLITGGFTIVGVLFGFLVNWVRDHFQRKHEDKIWLRNCRKETYAEYLSALHMLHGYLKSIADGTHTEPWAQEQLDSGMDLIRKNRMPIELLSDTNVRESVKDVEAVMNSARQITPPEAEQLSKVLRKIMFAFTDAARIELGVKDLLKRVPSTIPKTEA